MPGHWTASVFLSTLSIASVATAAGAARRRAWREMACWATAAAGVGHLAAQNEGLVGQALPGLLLLSAFMVRMLLLRRAAHTPGA
ncbi:hypothetical protein ACFWF9_10435 [Streptomyces roseolus]|uniref:hypothetical protein n=1 Tax=Streptomyces roseolus TaxID=67358 RepID=UPI00365482F8